MAAPVFVVAFCSDAPTSPETSLAGEDSGGLATALDDGNTIHACKKNQSGTVRLVDDAEQCLPNETLVEWGIQGPAGPSGIVDAHVHVASGNHAGGGIESAVCEPGEVALGGGYQSNNLFLEVRIDRPAKAEGGIVGFVNEGERPNAWTVEVNDPDSDDEFSLFVVVICAPTGGES